MNNTNRPAWLNDGAEWNQTKNLLSEEFDQDLNEGSRFTKEEFCWFFDTSDCDGFDNDGTLKGWKNGQWFTPSQEQLEKFLHHLQTS